MRSRQNRFRPIKQLVSRIETGKYQESESKDFGPFLVLPGLRSSDQEMMFIS
jgi:hypothetical protein